MQEEWLDLDFDSTVKAFEYTKRSVQRMNRIIDTDQFAKKSADEIFQYLTEEMEIVLFPDYLKRYIHARAEMNIQPEDITEDICLDIVNRAFVENNAPHSFKETKKKRKSTIRAWLKQDSMRRSTVFLLGFGLNMSAEDVTVFLQKVCKEADFDFSNPEETVFWYCYKNHLPYPYAQGLLDRYEQMEGADMPDFRWNAIQNNPKAFLLNNVNLNAYLSALKFRGVFEKEKKAVATVFEELYDRCREIIAQKYSDSADIHGERKIWTMDDIRPSDVEKYLCGGIPINLQGNRAKISASRFGKLFQYRKMSRQRIYEILNDKRDVERFDLITLLFLIYAETVEPNWPTERFIKYVKETNALLHQCNMLELYPVNPYEAFVMMCIAADYPLETYTAIWEMSFADGEQN